MPNLPITQSEPARRTRRRSAESQQEFKAELVECAKALYREHGYEGVSIRALTETFGMSAMSFYGYFDSKQELIRCIWIDFFRELLDALLAAGGGRRTPLGAMEAHAKAFIGYWEAHPDHYRLVYMSEELSDGASTSAFTSDPIYRRLRELTRERVMACCHGRPIDEKSLALAGDLIFVKALGFLHATLAIQRYKFADRARLRRLVIKDIVDTAASADTRN
jgi:AcrR family transcriptional regulator